MRHLIPSETVIIFLIFGLQNKLFVTLAPPKHFRKSEKKPHSFLESTIFGNIIILQIANFGKDACRQILAIRLINSWKSGIWYHNPSKTWIGHSVFSIKWTQALELYFHFQSRESPTAANSDSQSCISPPLGGHVRSGTLLGNQWDEFWKSTNIGEQALKKQHDGYTSSWWEVRKHLVPANCLK